MFQKLGDFLFVVLHSYLYYSKDWFQKSIKKICQISADRIL